VVLPAVLRKISTTLAGWILCLGVSASIFTILAHYSDSYGLLVFLLPILFSVFLFDWKQVSGFVGLILISSFYLNHISFKEASLQANFFIPVLLLLFVSTFLLLLFNNLTSTIDWYAKKYESAHRNEQIIRDNEAKLERLVKSLNDYEKYLRITNEMLGKARDEAEEARNVKQIFVQNVSHELRTPLNLIIGFSETMINTPQEYGEVNWTPELKGDIECIFQNSQHLKALIDDVLDLAALENKKYEIEVADIDLNTLIREAVLSAEVSFSSKGLYLKTDFNEEILMVRADLVRIKQVILNLLSNALKYTRKGGVVISSRRDNGMAKVTVRDTGKGIPEDALEKVFEAFYQVDKSSSREDSGTGLGLSISKQLIHLHGGEMKIASVMGKGTSVSFTVPISK
jgi:signal transduction histidine kinase